MSIASHTPTRHEFPGWIWSLAVAAAAIVWRLVYRRLPSASEWILSHLPVERAKVTDPGAIARAGVMSTPGISVDGKLVHAGGLPDAAKLEGWLAA